MENENVKVVSDALTGSLESTQKTATDTEKLVQQVQAMSGKDVHEEIVRVILADDKTPLAGRINLVHRENADYDSHEENNTGRVIRMQETQTENVGKATSWWSQNWGWVVTCGVVVIAAFTPGGRRLITTAAKSLAA